MVHRNAFLCLLESFVKQNPGKIRSKIRERYSLNLLLGNLPGRRPVGTARQKRYFNANWIRRGATEVWVITPKFAVPSVVPGLLNWGWLREL